MKLEPSKELASFFHRHLRLERRSDYDGETIIELLFVWEEDGVEDVVLIDQIGLGDY